MRIALLEERVDPKSLVERLLTAGPDIGLFQPGIPGQAREIALEEGAPISPLQVQPSPDLVADPAEELKRRYVVQRGRKRRVGVLHGSA
jgi:hypothetical protein